MSDVKKLSKISMPISIYALGGLCEVGKNCYCVEDEHNLILIDCGVLFPGNEYPGINYLIPNFSHIKNNNSKIKALFITHGHEDHIGGIPFLLQFVNIPVIYAPKLAAALIHHKLDDFRISHKTTIVEYDSDTIIPIDRFKISFFRVTHSIPDSFGIVIDSPEGRIVTTGDFKIDLTPIGKDIELQKIAKLGQEGVDLLLSDSTNAENEGYTPSESNVFDSINDIFDRTKGRLIISTFSSNISRIKQICQAALTHNRKIAVIGRSMQNALYIAREQGHIDFPDGSIVDQTEIKSMRPHEAVIICTGSQGEPMAALSRIATGEHKDVTIMPGDTVIFSSSAIPGNGASINTVVNQLTRCGAEVITNSILSDIHSSGHPSKMELKLMLKLLKPKYFMPVHGEYRMLSLHASLAQTVGVDKSNCFVLENGQTLTLVKNKISPGFNVPCGITFIDGNTTNTINENVIIERKKLIEDGLVTIVVGINQKSLTLSYPVKILTKGFVYSKSVHLISTTKKEVEKEVNRLLSLGASQVEIRNGIKNIVGPLLNKYTLLKPTVVPLLLYVD